MVLSSFMGRGFAIALVSFGLAAATASAFDLRPIMIQLAPKGPQASQSVVVHNTHPVPIAVQVSVQERTQNPDGTDTLVPADENFIILPPQMAIAPGASQSVRVRWIGDSNPPKELAYRLVVEQVPVDLGAGGAAPGEHRARVDVRYRYEAALYVVPPTSQPLAKLVSVTEIAGDGGKRELQLRIANSGTRRAILDKSRLTLAGPGRAPITLEGEQLKELRALNILAGAERVVKLPWPDGMPSGLVQGQLETKYVVFN